MKKALFIVVAALLLSSVSIAQVAINTDGSLPDNSAMLDVKSTNQGILLPRISASERDLIPSPATGLLLFNTTTNQIDFYNGSSWCQIDVAFVSSTIGALSSDGGISINSSDTPPANSSLLDVNNPTRGVLIPRTTPDLITNPAAGLIIYNTASDMVCYFNGSQWISLCSASTGATGSGGSQSSMGIAIKPDNSAPDPSAILDVSAADKGVLFPRLSNDQRDLLLPVSGLLIYNTTTNCFEYYYGAENSGSAKAINGSGWYQLLGNTLSPDAIVIDATNSQLLSDSVQLSQGIYIFQFSGTPPVLEVGSIITGSAGQGFLRKITGITNPGNPVTLQTQQAAMEELFDNADIGFQSGISSTGNSPINPNNVKVNYLANGVTLNPDGFTYNFSNTVIFQNSNFTFKITDGSAVFNPDFIADIRFRLFHLSKFRVSTANSTLALNCNVNLHATGSANLEAFNFKLADVDKSVPIPGLPVWVVINTKLNAKLDLSVGAAMDVNTGFSDTYAATLGVNYEDNAWSGIYNITDNLAVNPVDISGQINLGQKLNITPEVSVKFYGIAGTYFTPELWEQFKLDIASPSLDWNSSLDVGLEATVGITAAIIGNIAAFSQTYPFSKELWKAPDVINIVSGNNQQGTPGQPLPIPLKVVVKDTLGNPLPYVPVYFQVKQGGGSVSAETVMTNSTGNAETIWTFGSQTGQQVVRALIKNANLQTIDSTDFANFTPCGDSITYSGKKYGTVLIGAQCWFAQNLNNGTRINGSSEQTNNSTIEKYCYNDLESNCDIYGGLYLWDEAMQYSTTEGVQAICPTGWHIPTDAEWTTVTTFLGGEDVAGGKMKSTGTIGVGTGLWSSPNTGATNESGFTAVPAGCSYYGAFYNVGTTGYWWSSTVLDTEYAWSRYTNYYYSSVGRDPNLKWIGESVRCLRNY